MPTDPLIYNINAQNLSAPVVTTAETVVATLAGVVPRFAEQQIKIHGYCVLLTGADGTFVVVRIRRDSLTGTQVGSDISIATVNSVNNPLEAYVVDARPDFANGVYVMTVAADSATHNSTVKAYQLDARAD